MRVIQVHRHGGPEVMTLHDQAPGRVPPGHARVQVSAIGVNFIDLHHRSGRYPRPVPYVPGGEGSGTVVEVGPGTTEVRVGQRVAWQGVPGSYAEQVVAPANLLITVPDDVTDLQAAALPVNGLTAHYLATSSFPIQPGDVVVVHAGAGGVGSLLTQIARLRGARVVATVSDPVKALSCQADTVTGYEDFPDAVSQMTGGHGAAAVFDSIGGDTFEQSLRSLRRRGTLVLYGLASGPVAPFDLERLNHGGSLTITRPSLRDFVATSAELAQRSAQLWTWLSAGLLHPHIGQTYHLADAVSAHRDLEARRTTGKLLLTPTPRQNG
jgi:NADPH2:quinone reductase